MWSDVEHWPRWNDGVERAETDGPLETGRRILMVLPDDPEPVELVIEEVEAEQHFVDRATVGDLTIRTTHRAEERDGGGCVISYRTDITGPGADTHASTLGAAITADVPDVVNQLIAAASTTPAEERGTS